MRNGATVPNERGVDISIRPPGDGKKKTDAKADATDDKLRNLFQALGGDGSIKVQRIRPEDGKLEWCGSISVTEDVADTLEEQIARRWGGGDYQLEGRHKSEYIGAARVSIARELKAQHAAAAPEAPAAAAPPSNALNPLDVMQMLDQREERARASTAAQMHAQMQMQATTMATMMQLAEAGNQRTTQMMQVVVAALAGVGGKASGGIADVMQALTLIDRVKGMAGADAPLPAETTMTERVLGMFAAPIASRVGDVIASQMKPAAPSAPSALPPVPPQPAAPPAVVPVPAAHGAPHSPRVGHQGPPLPDRGTAKMPPRVRPLSNDEIKARASQARRPGPRPSSAPAPASDDVKPEERAK